MNVVPAPCPSCRGTMEAVTLEGRLGRPVAIEVCRACHGFWFDGFESLQLAPGSVLTLVRLVGEAGGPRALFEGGGPCPRCGRTLRLVRDRQRQTTFEYFGCPARHGRLISYFNFLREKNFIRPLSAAQIAALRARVATVNCSNCGAPVDLVAGTACAHCGSALSMLDVGQAEALVEELKSADRPAGAVDPALALNLIRARRDVDAAFNAFDRDPRWMTRASSQGLIEAAIGEIFRRIL